MKRYNNLYSKIINIDNIKKAAINSQKNKKSNLQVIDFNKNFEENVEKIHLLLLSETYTVSNYKTKKIKDGNKIRELRILPYYPDRVIQHAILQIINPILEKVFINTTYSAIRKRGIHKCLKDLNKALINKENTKYCLKLDIKKYYDNVNHNILKEFLLKKFKDNKLINILFLIINSSKGIPIGSYLSQYFGNFYLSYFGHWLKEVMKVKYVFIYMDDIVILHSDKQYLYNLKHKIISYLDTNLKLQLSNYQVFPVTKSIDFVGYKSYPTHILLRKSIKQRFKKVLLKYPNKKSIASYKGWLVHSNSINLQTFQLLY